MDFHHEVRKIAVEVPLAVVKSAIETGVAAITKMNWDDYREELKERLGLSKEVIRVMINKAQKNPVRVVYPEGEEGPVAGPDGEQVH